MSRYDQYGPLDDQPNLMGDRFFVGVNMRLDPAQLPPGYASEAINCRFRDGIASTRLGFTVVPWMNKIVGTDVLPWGVVHGQGVFSDPFTLAEYLIIAADGQGFFTRPCNAPEPLNLHGATFDGEVNFTQAYDVMIAHRGVDLPALAMPRVTEGFREVVQSIAAGVAQTSEFTYAGSRDEVLVAAHDLPPGGAQAQTVAVSSDGTLPAGLREESVYYARVVDEDTLTLHNSASGAAANTDRVAITDAGTGAHRMTWTTPSETDGAVVIPNAERSLFFQNRLFIPVGDEVAVSDYGDYTRYLPVAQEFQINQGSADELVAIYKFNDTTIVPFKEHSIYAVNNVYGNLAALQQDELTNQFGLVAKKSIAHVGTDLWFLSELGVMSLTQTVNGKLQGVVLPVSDPIQPLIDRINWRYASGAVSAYWDNKYYLAVPLDDAEMLGPDLAPVGATMNESHTYMIPTVVGALYRWEPGEGDPRTIASGGVTLTGAGEFVAREAVAYVHSIGESARAGGSLKRVYRGINNAVLVYDFLQGAWCGHDEAPGIDFRELFLFTHNGRRRLFTVTTSGYVLLYEEDYEDQLTVPYTEVTIVAVPPVDALITVNGAATTAAPNLTNIDGWGCATLQSARENLVGEYWRLEAAQPPRAPNTYPVPCFASDGTIIGATFYATNGVIPAVVTLDQGTELPGEFAEITEHGTQPIRTKLITRGYASERGSLDTFNWMVADIQTWAPSTTITVLLNGVEEVQEILTNQTRDRTAYYLDATPAYSADNANGDFLAPKREDYSLNLGDDAEAVPEFSLHTTPGGVPLDRHQEVRVSEKVGARTRSARLQFENAAGRIRVMSAGVEADERPLVPATEG